MSRKITISLILLIPFLSVSAFADSLREIGNDYYAFLLNEVPYLQLKHGVEIKRLPDLSLKHAEENAAFQRSLVERLGKLETGSFTQDEQISYEMLRWLNEGALEEFRYFQFTNLVTPYASPIPGVTRIFSEYRFDNVEALAAYEKLLAQYPDWIRSIEAHLRMQMEHDIVLPREELEQVIPFIQSMGSPASSNVCHVAANRLSTLDPEQAAAFQARVDHLVDSKIVPAYQDLARFLGGDYKARAPEQVGLSQYPGGKEYYRLLVKHSVTYDVTPEVVHQTGLEMVDRIENEMLKLQQQIGFKGSPREFRTSLAIHPKFTPTSPEQIGEVLMSYVRRIEPQIDSFFLHKPKAPYGVRRLDPALEGSQTFGYYQEPTATEPMGIYFYNGSNIKDRSLMLAGSLIYHELLPGHHFQLSLQNENEALPAFRREAFATAYVEGWGEYSSGLAGEMGMYRDPYEQYGRLAAEMFLTCRLVVDTGMNYLGWPREKAAEYMKEHTLLSDREISTETLRYSTDIPGQALAYKMGCNRIRELRELAKKELGEQFDIRVFHDVILGSGSMPMTVLEQHIRRYIDGEKAHRSN